MKKKNPILQQKYDQGFQDAKATAAALFAMKLGRIDAIKGIGPKKKELILNMISDNTMTPEERQKYQTFLKEIQEYNKAQKGE
ncbi:hypothetical protein ACTFSJ_27640 [Bacillus cereus group sp. MYBK12-2]|uniref:hypothetical protein n=1 Tax=Bacillus cereus group sp. MYBK12-2 TaxID=3450689 RepID=UPI0032F9B21A|nr:hypothetical protein [Bacillus pacificus]HDR7653550.1 hypothetical protein [Bacillus pacificus]